MLILITMNRAFRGFPRTLMDLVKVLRVFVMLEERKSGSKSASALAEHVMCVLAVSLQSVLPARFLGSL